jgi:hypothetical protein
MGLRREIVREFDRDYLFNDYVRLQRLCPSTNDHERTVS